MCRFHPPSPAPDWLAAEARRIGRSSPGSPKAEALRLLHGALEPLLATVRRAAMPAADDPAGAVRDPRAGGRPTGWAAMGIWVLWMQAFTAEPK